MRRIDKTKGFGLGIVNDEITKFVHTAFSALHSLSLGTCREHKNVPVLPDTERVPFTWDIYLLLSGKKM